MDCCSVNTVNFMYIWLIYFLSDIVNGEQTREDIWWLVVTLGFTLHTSIAKIVRTRRRLITFNDV